MSRSVTKEAQVPTTTDRTGPLVRHELALTAQQKTALQLLADRQDRSVNAIVRQAVDAFLSEPREASQ